MSNWSSGTTAEEAAARAGGRRRYHALRRHQALLRRGQVIRLLSRYSWPERGAQSRIAQRLGVDRATISRDVRAIFAAHQNEGL